MTILKEKTILSYPIELGSKSKTLDGYEEQYIILSIMVDDKSSKLGKDKKYSNVYTAERTSSTTGIGSTEKNTDPDIKELYGQEAVDKEKFVKKKNLVKLDKVIVLPMPNDHVVSGAVSYSEVDATLLSKGAEFFQTENKAATTSDLARLGKNVGISAILNTFKSGITNKDALLAEERIIFNPRKEVLFDGFGFRRFSFRYTFAPRNQNEANMVNDIIQTLRYYQLPELSAGKIFYLFPAEFEISFMNGSKLNDRIPKIAPCALERINVNYSPNGVWATLPDGSPVQTDITMEFIELELIDRNRVFSKDSPITSGY